jgi:hypothetical protein
MMVTGCPEMTLQTNIFESGATVAGLRPPQ